MENKLTKAKKIVKVHLHCSLAGGFIPIPGLDIAAVLSVQMLMINSLSKLYEEKFSKDVVRASIIALIGSLVPFSLARGAVGSAFKMIPLIGLGLGAASMSVFSGACTYAIGKVYIQHFESGGNVFNFNSDAMREYFKSVFQEGKQGVRDSA